MSYIRVIPRDLFNEANLLKCLGALYIALETANLPGVTLEHDGEAFDIDQSPDDGSTYVINVRLIVGGVDHSLRRPLNSRAPWPLYMDASDCEIAVYNDDGTLSDDFRAFCADGGAA